MSDVEKVPLVSLVRVMVCAAEKAARVARACRAEEHLFGLLVQEKGAAGNDRFAQDFKTLADVLIQEMVRHDVAAVFPQMREQVLGEEDATFTNAAGEKKGIAVQAEEVATRALLTEVLGAEHAAAAATLARIAHEEVRVGDDDQVRELEDRGTLFAPAEMGIWIDPIDGTNEYIKGGDGASTHGIVSGGLAAATVLIGAFDTALGCPVAGVVNQPFHRKSPGTGDSLDGGFAGRHVWGVCGDDVSLCNVPAPSGNTGADAPVAVLSQSEGEEVQRELGYHFKSLLFAAGCGYKLLCVIDGHADAYVLSKGSAYKWDTCGPHAILRSLGGDVVRHRDGEDVLYHQPDDAAVSDAHRWSNSAGVVAFSGSFRNHEYISRIQQSELNSPTKKPRKQ